MAIGSTSTLLVAGAMVAAAIVLTFVLVVRHMQGNPHPVLRSCTVRILLLVPIYSLEAFTCLCTMNSKVFFIDDELRYLRKFYEAVVVFSFLQLVLVSAGGPEEIVKVFAHYAELEESLERCKQDAEEISRYHSSGLLDEDLEDRRVLSVAEADYGRDGSPCSSIEVVSLHSPSLPLGRELAGEEIPRYPGRAGYRSAGLLAVNLDDSFLSVSTSASSSPSSRRRGWPSPSQHLRRHLRQLRRSRLLSWFVPVWPSASRMLQWCILGPLLYVGVGSVCAVVGLFMSILQVSDPNGFGMHDGIGHIVVRGVGRFLLFVSSLSASLSLHEISVNVREEIKELRLTSKKLSITLVVFVTYWQELALGIALRANLVPDGFIKSLGCTDNKEFLIVCQNLALCCEMLATALIHNWIWRTHDFIAIADKLDKLGRRSFSRSSSRRETLSSVVDLGFISETVRHIESMCHNADALMCHDTDDEDDSDVSSTSTEAASNPDSSFELSEIEFSL